MTRSTALPTGSGAHDEDGPVLALEDDGNTRRKAGESPSKRVSALRGLAARAVEAKEAKEAQQRASAPVVPKPAAPKPASHKSAPDSGGEAARPSLVRAMMRNMEAGAVDAPPKRPRIPPEPKRRSRAAPAAIPEAPDLSAAFDNEPDDRVKRARRAAERVRQRAAPTLPAEPPAPQPATAPARKERIEPAASPTFAPKPVRLAQTKPFAGFEWDIASRYLRARRKEGFISVIAGFSLVGIGLGVATLIIVMAVMTGFRETLIEQILGVDPHVNVVSQTEKFDNYDTLAVAIRQVDGIIAVAPTVEGQVLASSASGHSGVLVRGMRREDFAKLKVVTAPEASVGDLTKFEGDDGIAIGDGVARRLGIRLGDSITLISPDGDLTPFGVTPRSKSYPVTYIFKLGLTQYDSAFVYMPLRESQLYFNKKGVVDSLEVTVADPNGVDEYVSDIRQAAQSSIGVYTWKDSKGTLIGALDVERNVMFLILTLIILVAALNIISGLVMLVKDKARDVAIMRTMGMARGSILRIFFICGSSIGVIGSVIGCILGVLFCLNIGAIQAAVESVTGPVFPADVYGLSGLPAELVWTDVVKILFMALGLSFIATLYPAWKAANLDPVEALRYE